MKRRSFMQCLMGLFAVTVPKPSLLEQWNENHIGKVGKYKTISQSEINPDLKPNEIFERLRENERAMAESISNAMGVPSELITPGTYTHYQDHLNDNGGFLIRGDLAEEIKKFSGKKIIS